MPETLHPTVCPPRSALLRPPAGVLLSNPITEAAPRTLLAPTILRRVPLETDSEETSVCGPLLAVFSEGKSCEGVREGGLDGEAA